MNIWEVKLKSSCAIAKNATIMGKVYIDDYSSVYPGAVIRADEFDITIGKRTNIQDNVTIHVGLTCPCSIGSDVTVGHNAIVHGCSIGDRSMIGMGSIIMDHAVVGSDCIIGAGALVPENTLIPDKSLVIGIPGKIKRSISDKECEDLIASAKLYIDESQKLVEYGIFFSGTNIPFDNPTITLKQI